ncbi:DUF1127 domain-containing protein [Aliiroseovarius crassostreae]|nr:DUF1127 domain-containing protein [Aliiroseovarius crassostreae]
MAHATEILNAHAGIVDRFFSMLEGWKEAYANHALFRETVRELSKLTNAELNDLGIGRGEIHAIAHKAAYGA